MKKYSIAIFAFGMIVTSNCSKVSAPGAQTPTPTPASSPAVVVPAASVSPGASAAATPPVIKPNIPANIPERLRRPLTLDEIMKLPPETRDMILKAQGRPLPKPTKKP